MIQFVIIETDDGLTIVECPPDGRPEYVAEEHGGLLVDAGPFSSYQDAYDALENLEVEDEERER